MMPAEFGLKCSLCEHPVGKGHGKRTAIRIDDATIQLTGRRAPQIRGLVDKGSIVLCLPCLEANLDEMIKAQTKHGIIQGKH